MCYQSRGNNASPFGYAGTACEYAEERVFTSRTVTYLGICLDSMAIQAHLSLEHFIDSALFLTGQVVCTEGISEASGTDGGGFFSVPSGSATLRPLQFWL